MQFIYMYMYICVHPHTNAYMNVHVYCMEVHTYVCIIIHVHVHIHVRTHVHAYTVATNKMFTFRLHSTSWKVPGSIYVRTYTSGVRTCAYIYVQQMYIHTVPVRYKV